MSLRGRRNNHPERKDTTDDAPQRAEMGEQGARYGADAALKDTWHRPHAPVITEEAKAWVVHLGLLQTEGTRLRGRTMDAKFAGSACSLQHAKQGVGHPSLAKAGKATMQRILSTQELHPERVHYYLERRDPECESKMKDILLALSGSCAAE